MSKFIENTPTHNISHKFLKKAIEQPKIYKNAVVMKERKNEQEQINRGRMDEFRKAGATKRAKKARKKESNTD